MANTFEVGLNSIQNWFFHTFCSHVSIIWAQTVSCLGVFVDSALWIRQITNLKALDLPNSRILTTPSVSQGAEDSNNTLTPDGTETLETANFWNFIYSLTSGTPLDVTRHRGRQQWRHQRFMTSSKQFRRVCFLCVLPDTIVRVFTVSVTVTKICGKSSFNWFRHLGVK